MMRLAMSLGLALLSTAETCAEDVDGARDPSRERGAPGQMDLGLPPCDAGAAHPYTELCDPAADHPSAPPEVFDLGPPPADPYAPDAGTKDPPPADQGGGDTPDDP
ncbi:MAG: hypothetical protein AAGH15_27070 [Myxococcota bacterium]